MDCTPVTSLCFQTPTVIPSPQADLVSEHGVHAFGAWCARLCFELLQMEIPYLSFGIELDLLSAPCTAVN